MMQSKYIREQKRYYLNELIQIFQLSSEGLVDFIKKLKAYGVLKMVKATPLERDLSDLIDEEIELVDEEMQTEDYYYVFTFVGVLAVGNIIIKCYPKYILTNQEPLNEMKQVLKVLKHYNAKEQIIKLFNGDEEKSSFNLLSVMLFFIEDYNENGLYNNQQQIIENNGDGEILWDNTINETFAIVSSNRPYYLDLKTINTVDDEYDYFKRLHQCIVTECSRRLNKAGILDLFELDSVIISEEELDDLGEIDYILYRLQKELSVQYVNKKQSLLKTMYAFVAQSKIYEDTFGLSMYGTNSFNLVWEKVCASVFDNKLNVYLKDLPKPLIGRGNVNQDKTLLEIIDKPLWKLSNSVCGVEAAKSLTPDLISIYQIGDQFCFGIFDAKYYLIHLTDTKVEGQPGVGDITKQYLYQLAYQKFITTQEYSYVQNAFLFPDEGETIEYIGQAEMNILSRCTNEQLENISAVKLPARKMYDLYLKNMIIPDMAENLIKLPVMCVENKTFTSRILECLSANKINSEIICKSVDELDCRKVIYPKIIRNEIGARLIYDLLYPAASRYIYEFNPYETLRHNMVAESFADNETIRNELAEVAITIESNVKKQTENEYLNKDNIKEVLVDVLKYKSKISMLTGEQFILEITEELWNLLRNLYD